MTQTKNVIILEALDIFYSSMKRERDLTHVFVPTSSQMGRRASQFVSLSRPIRSGLNMSLDFNKCLWIFFWWWGPLNKCASIPKHVYFIYLKASYSRILAWIMCRLFILCFWWSLTWFLYIAKVLPCLHRHLWIACIKRVKQVERCLLLLQV
jgi:hypothetical protein